jgi:D-amino-acid oxidase
MKKRIAIIGAGISGLSVASLLDKNDYEIIIVAKEFFPDITSNKAAAFWFPYHVRNDNRGIGWCGESYRRFTEMSTHPETGVSMKKLIKPLRKGIMEAENNIWLDFMPSDSYEILPPEQTPVAYQTVYEIKVPLIETQIFLPYLMEVLKSQGVLFKREEISNFSDLSNKYDAVVNCTALGSRALCNDAELIPVRGQVALLQTTSRQTDLYLDNETPLYVVPRQDAIIVGGTYEENEDKEITEHHTISRLTQNAFDVFPFLAAQPILGSWAGLRPFRPTVRVEHQNGTNIFHNYGHGGSGFTISYGTAKEIVKMVDKYFTTEKA